MLHELSCFKDGFYFKNPCICNNNYKEKDSIIVLIFHRDMSLKIKHLLPDYYTSRILSTTKLKPSDFYKLNNNQYYWLIDLIFQILFWKWTPQVHIGSPQVKIPIYRCFIPGSEEQRLSPEISYLKGQYSISRYNLFQLNIFLKTKFLKFHSIVINTLKKPDTAT